MENSLGLDVHGKTASQSLAPDSIQPAASPSIQSKENVEDDESTHEKSEKTTSPQVEDKAKKEKGKPYIPATPPTRAKMSPEELAERMEKIRLQNEKIKERREHVKADEEAFNTSVAADRARQAANRKVQAQVNQNREQNAKRKLEKMGNREWDSGKQGGEWKQGSKGRGRSSFPDQGKDGGGQRTTSNNKGTSDTSLPSANESYKRSSREIAPHITQEVSSSSNSSQPDTQEIGEKD